MKNKPQPLSEFYRDTATKENVHAYLVEFLKEQAVKELFDNESDSGAQAVALAKKYVDLAFENMDYIFGNKVDKKEQVNGAR